MLPMNPEASARRARETVFLPTPRHGVHEILDNSLGVKPPMRQGCVK
ncbi:hypothetical protein [Achromobacter aloeverae]|nr:hypothetical protein [Achromobacter aloeverae]